METFKDGYTIALEAKMSEFEDRIYNMEDDMSSFKENAEAIIKYLSDIRCSMPLGMALRRYLCTKFSDGRTSDNSGYIFTLSSKKTVVVKDYLSDQYDITVDDVAEYTEIFMDISKRYNTDSQGNLGHPILKSEARRLLKVTTTCLRAKLFLISFALHMDSDEVTKLLTDVLAEQTYNFRNPDEIIAYYCHTHDEVNNYLDYCRLKSMYKNCCKNQSNIATKLDNYTIYAELIITARINTEEQLMDFLCKNRSNFAGYSMTAYQEFIDLFNRALEISQIQLLSNDDYVNSYESVSQEQRIEKVDRINRARQLQRVSNTEQLAKCMLQHIPRATTEKLNKNGKKVISSDFIPVFNGENTNSSKKSTTSLPKDITKNLLVKDRLDDLVNRKKPVERKDLVFLKFYLMYLELIQRDAEYTFNEYLAFKKDCDNMLIKCGMSRLYPANRFENLILISLVSSNPFEMFEEIIEASFFNEPTA